MSDVAIRVDKIGKRYRLGELQVYRALRDVVTEVLTSPLDWLRGSRHANDTETIWALRDVSFDVKPGEVVGIIGRNGAGKTTLLKLLSRITEPTEGAADVYGSVGSLLEVGTGFHPELTGRENVFLNGAILGMHRSEIEAKFDEILSFAGVEQFADTPVKRYSTGMQVRLAFSVAAHFEPDILLVDEVLAVGDIEFQKKCLGRMEEVSSEGRTILFISHSMPAVMRLCPRVILLDRGRVIADGPAREVIRTYLETGLGTSAARKWSTPGDAPGDDAVRLKSVCVLDDSGSVSEEIDITKAVEVEVEYWLQQPSTTHGPGIALSFSDDDGVLLFASTDLTVQERGVVRGPGVIRSTCRIPGNLLAEGEVLVEVALVSHQPPALHGVERDVVAFHVVDRSKGEGARGDFGHDWPGVVRPKLDWKTQQLDREDAADAR